MKTLILVLLLTWTALCGALCAGTSALFDQETLNRISEESATPPPSAPAVDEKNTSLKRFPQNFGRTFAGLFSWANFKPLVVGGCASGTAVALDQSLHDYYKSDDTSDVITNTGATLGKPYVVAPAVTGLLIWGHYSSNQRFHAFTYALAEAYTLNLGLTAGIKAATQRERPDKSNNHSFPSGHAADSFMIATVISNYYGPKATFIAYTAACFVSYSRIRRDVHWASDVVAGATLGYIVGKTASRVTGGTRQERRVSWLPMLDPVNRAYGVSFAVRLP